MKNIMKGMIAFVFTLVMAYALIPADTYALNGTMNNEGTIDDPYLIEDLADLKAFTSNKDDYKDKYVKLANNIVTDGKVQTKSNFQGTLLGDNHTVTALTNPLIGTNNGTIKDVLLVESNISYKNVSNIGGVVNVNNGLIDGCSNDKGSITITSEKTGPGPAGEAKTISNIGGIAGINKGIIRNSFNTSNIKINAKGENIGGIAGQEVGASSILNCYNWGKVEAQEDVGGIAGDLDKEEVKPSPKKEEVKTPEVDNSYNQGTVSGTKDKEYGSLVGDGDDCKISGYAIEKTVDNDKIVGDQKKEKDKFVKDNDKALQELLEKLNKWVDSHNTEANIYKHWYILDKYPIFAPNVVVTFLAGENGTIGSGDTEIIIESYIGASWNTINVPSINPNEGWVANGWDEEFPETIIEDLTFTAEYLEDVNKDGIADIYEKVITFVVVNGTWKDGSKKTIEVWVPLYDEQGNLSEDGVGHLTKDQIPSGMIALEGYGNGAWDKDISLEVSGNEPETYTYTFKDLGGTGSTTPVITNPNTSDNPFTYMILALLSLIGLIVTSKKLKRFN